MSQPISLDEAKARRVCRVCQQPIRLGVGMPMGWMEDFGRMTYPDRVTLEYGNEFAHTDCLDASNDDQGWPPRPGG